MFMSCLNNIIQAKYAYIFKIWVSYSTTKLRKTEDEYEYPMVYGKMGQVWGC